MQITFGYPFSRLDEYVFSSSRRDGLEIQIEETEA